MPTKKSNEPGLHAKVVQARVNDMAKVAEELEAALEGFLTKNPEVTVRSTHANVLDIGGTSNADILAIYTIFYTN